MGGSWVGIGSTRSRVVNGLGGGSDRTFVNSEGLYDICVVRKLMRPLSGASL